MSEEKIILVVGAGPAGLFAANKLAESGNKVIIINRDIKYGGLAEYGIYVSKHKMKEGLRKQFRKILDKPNIEYYGNVKVGNNSDITLEELKELNFDAIVVSVGAQGTKKIGVEGEEASGVFHAKDLVYHYNYLPPFSEKEYNVGKKVAIIGVGNVMVDIAHWLTHVKHVDEVVAVARRGPNERAYTDKEIKAVSFNMDKEDIRSELERVRSSLEAVNQDVDSTYQELTKDADKPYYPDKPSPTRFTFKFLSSPKKILTNENNQVIGMELEENVLVDRNGKLGAKGTGNTSVMDIDSVVFAIGDTVDSNIGLPLNEWGEFSKNENPYEHDPNAHEYEMYDKETDSIIKGVFVVGWSRKASDGLVGIAKKDGETGTKYVLQYLENHESKGNTAERLEKFHNLLKDKNINVVTKNDIKMLEKVEFDEAEKRGLEFYKFNFNSDMLKVIEEERKKA